MDTYLDPSSLKWERNRKLFYYGISDDIFHKLPQARMFTIVDFSKGYYHIKHDKAVSFLTTFNTLLGRFRVTIIVFVLTEIGDTFQCKLDTIFNNLDFCMGIAVVMIIQ